MALAATPMLILSLLLTVTLTLAPAACEESEIARIGGDAITAATKASTASIYSADLHHELVAMARLVAQRAAAKISSERMQATADVIHMTIVDVEGDDFHVVTSKVHVLAQCASNRTAADCVSCLKDSAQAVAWDLGAAHGDGGVAATVEGSDCNIRFEVSSELGPRSDPSDHSNSIVKHLQIANAILAVANLILTVVNLCL